MHLGLEILAVVSRDFVAWALHHKTHEIADASQCLRNLAAFVATPPEDTVVVLKTMRQECNASKRMTYQMTYVYIYTYIHTCRYTTTNLQNEVAGALTHVELSHVIQFVMVLFKGPNINNSLKRDI